MPIGHIVHIFALVGSLEMFHRESVICILHLVYFSNCIDVFSTFNFTIFAGHGFICTGISIVSIHGMSMIIESSHALKLGYIYIVTFQLCICMSLCA